MQLILHEVAHQECFLLCSTLYSHTGAFFPMSVNSKWYYVKSRCMCETQTLTLSPTRTNAFLFVSTQFLAFFSATAVSQTGHF